MDGASETPRKEDQPTLTLLCYCVCKKKKVLSSLYIHVYILSSERETFRSRSDARERQWNLRDGSYHSTPLLFHWGSRRQLFCTFFFLPRKHILANTIRVAKKFYSLPFQLSKSLLTAIIQFMSLERRAQHFTVWKRQGRERESSNLNWLIRQAAAAV